MGSIKAYVGNILKEDGEDELRYEGIGLYAGQSAGGTFSWQTDPIDLGADVATITTEIRAAIIAASESNGNTFGMTDTVITAGGPAVLG